MGIFLFPIGQGRQDLHTVASWSSCIYEQKNMQRKVERDWKMVYLCRREGTTEGSISWKFLFPDLRIAKVRVKFEITKFDKGIVKISYFDDKGEHEFRENQRLLEVFTCFMLPKMSRRYSSGNVS